MKRDIDFHRVGASQLSAHEALVNWARWVRPGRGNTGLHPMFRQFKPQEMVADPSEAYVPIDGEAGLKVEKIVTSLPEKHMYAIQWHYVFTSIHPRRVCRLLAVNEEGLSALVLDGRTMVKNRLHSPKAGI